MNKQSQKGGDNSTNVQAEKVTVGLSYSEARKVALDVFHANFLELAGVARNVARQRAEEITGEFLNKLQAENPEGLKNADEPDFQYALYTVQREYARTGDGDLGDLLIDLIVDRSKQPHRNILQIVLNESLNIAPKLTNDQISALGLIFLLKYTHNTGVGNLDKLGNYLDKYVHPFIEQVPESDASYQHLQFAGCGSIELSRVNLEDCLGRAYQGVFLEGVTQDAINKKELPTNIRDNFIIPCLNNNEKLQVCAINKDDLNERLKRHDVSEENKDKLLKLFDESKMPNDKIKEKCSELRPYMRSMFETWNNTPLASFTLTSVGIAIGHANIKRVVEEFTNLSIWIN